MVFCTKKGFSYLDLGKHSFREVNYQNAFYELMKKKLLWVVVFTCYHRQRTFHMDVLVIGKWLIWIRILYAYTRKKKYKKGDWWTHYGIVWALNSPSTLLALIILTMTYLIALHLWPLGNIGTGWDSGREGNWPRSRLEVPLRHSLAAIEEESPASVRIGDGWVRF